MSGILPEGKYYIRKDDNLVISPTQYLTILVNTTRKFAKHLADLS